MPGSFFVNVAEKGTREASILMRNIERDITKGMRTRLVQAAKVVIKAARAKTHSKRVAAAMSYDVDVRSKTDFQVRVGPSQKKAFFAHFLEFGTSHSRAFPFLAPAKEQTEDEVVELVGIPFVLRQRR